VRESADIVANGIGCRDDFLGVGRVHARDHLAAVVLYFGHFAAIVRQKMIPREVFSDGEVGKESK
jgi:hypothetical protein